MATTIFKDFIRSLSQRDFDLEHKRWIVYAGKLIATRGRRGRVDPIEVVNDTFLRVMMGIAGYECPETIDPPTFFAAKIKTSVERFIKQDQRRSGRETMYIDHLDHENPLWDTPDFGDRLEELTGQLVQALGARTGKGLYEYVHALPEIVSSNLNQDEAARLLESTTGRLANYRYRLSERFCGPGSANLWRKGK